MARFGRLTDAPASFLLTGARLIDPSAQTDAMADLAVVDFETNAESFRATIGAAVPPLHKEILAQFIPRQLALLIDARDGL